MPVSADVERRGEGARGHDQGAHAARLASPSPPPTTAGVGGGDPRHAEETSRGSLLDRLLASGAAVHREIRDGGHYSLYTGFDGIYDIS